MNKKQKEDRIKKRRQEKKGSSVENALEMISACGHVLILIGAIDLLGNNIVLQKDGSIACMLIELGVISFTDFIISMTKQHILNSEIEKLKLEMSKLEDQKITLRL